MPVYQFNPPFSLPLLPSTARTGPWSPEELKKHRLRIVDNGRSTIDESRNRVETLRLVPVGESPGGVLFLEPLQPIGSSGDIFVHLDPTSNRLFVTKEKNTLGESTRRRLYDVLHPNLVVYHGGGFMNGKKVECFDYRPGPTLSNILNTEALNRYLGAFERFNVILNAISGAEGLYEKKLFHRDIKPDNIVICFSEKGMFQKAVLIDLGITTDVNDFKKELKYPVATGTQGYYPPECFDHSLSGTDDDDILITFLKRREAYSIGKLMADVFGAHLTLLSDKNEVIEVNEDELADYIIKIGEAADSGGYYKVHFDENSPWKEAGFNLKILQELIQGLLNFDPEKRVTLDEAKEIIKTLLKNLNPNPIMASNHSAKVISGGVYKTWKNTPDIVTEKVTY